MRAAVLSARASLLACFQPAKVGPVVAFTAWVLSFAAILATWTYASAVATPLVQADAWYFLDVFVSRWLDGHLQFKDFFVQRGASDHAQPIQKLILLFHTKYFDMDFRVEGLIGVLFGAAFCLLVTTQLARVPEMGWRKALAPLFVVGLFAVGLSINSTSIYSWPLVTLSFSDLLFAALQIIAFLRLGAKGRLAWLGVVTFITSLLIDEIAILALIASLIAAWMGAGWHGKRLIRPTVVAAVGLVLARIAIDHLSRAAGVVAPGDPIDVHALLAALGKPDVWKAVVLPLVNSVAMFEHVNVWWGDRTSTAMFAIASIMAALHVWFWWVVLRRRMDGSGTAQVGFAVALMLLSYAFVAGIVLSRVPVFGWDYLNQPRYIVMYQVSCVAIMVLAHAQWIETRTPWGLRFLRAFPVALVVLAVYIQIPTARASWGLVPYISIYWSRAGLYLGDMANDPTAQPMNCPDIFSVCSSSPEQRARMLQLLKSHHLNVFSQGFQLRNRIYPSLDDIPAPEKKKEP